MAINRSTVQRLFLNPRHAMVALLFACTTSAFAWRFDGLWLLTLPGALLTMSLFGRYASESNRPLRLVLNLFATFAAVYLGAALWTWGNADQKQSSVVRGLFIFWLILIIPWMGFGPLSAMAFDGGETPQAYVFFWTSITYPISVALAMLFRRWTQYAVLFPFLNFAACFASSLLPK